jgi:flagellar export protein FliJ
MAAFHFELEPVVKIRRRAERQKQLALAVLEGQRVELERRVGEVQGRLVTQRADLRARLDGAGAGRGVDVGLVRLQAHASVHAVLELRRLAIEAAGLLQRLEAARAELLRATVARKAIEHLRAKALLKWRKQLARREALELDDLTLMRRGDVATLGGGGSEGLGEGAGLAGPEPMEIA